MATAKGLIKGVGHRVKIGRVVSTKMNKSVVVNVTYRRPHALYDVQHRKDKRFICHDEDEMAKEGDMVRIESCRPLSRHKHFTLTHVVQPAAGGDAFPVTPLPPFVRKKERKVKPKYKKGRGMAPDQIKGREAWLARWKEREELREKAKRDGVELDIASHPLWQKS